MNNKKIRVNIASYGGRNWLLETARELDKCGYEVRFYSYLPTYRAKKFGLKSKINHSYFFIAIPFLFLLYVTKRSFNSLYIFHVFFDYFTAWYMKPCDIFIGQSPMHVYSLNYARKKFGAKIIIERGTRHVNEQTEALKGNPILKGKSPMPNMFMKRDLKGYELADYITVPSQIVKKSFLLNGVLEDKIFVNPFGVNLDEFKPTQLDVHDNFDLIYVGQWSYRKGCDLLIEACNEFKFSLLHIGSIVDIAFPNDNTLMKHYDAVDQKDLSRFYSKAKVFVLPSREEGLALVQPQAVASGLPLVCSKYTGGRDLIKYIDDQRFIIEMEQLTVYELGRCVEIGLALAEDQKGLRTYASGLSHLLTWERYGERYNEMLCELL